MESIGDRDINHQSPSSEPHLEQAQISCHPESSNGAEAQQPNNLPIGVPMSSFSSEAHLPCVLNTDLPHRSNFIIPVSTIDTQQLSNCSGPCQRSGAPLTPATLASPLGHNRISSSAPKPKTQDYNRPRKRYEDICRIYECGWNGCSKAFGVLKHLNVHIDMQSHGPGRTAEEFEEACKDWETRQDAIRQRDASSQGTEDLLRRIREAMDMAKEQLVREI